MALTEREITLEAAYDRLDEEVAEQAQAYRDADNGSTYQQIAARRGRQAEDHRGGVAWAMDYPDTDATGSGWDIDSITLGALTKGDENRVSQAVEDIECTRQDAYVAVAVTDAPFLEHDPEDMSQIEYQKTIRNVVDLHPDFVGWVDAETGDLASAGDSGKSFMASVAEGATSATSTGENG